jgi:hypothetical protein
MLDLRAFQRALGQRLVLGPRTTDSLKPAPVQASCHGKRWASGVRAARPRGLYVGLHARDTRAITLGGWGWRWQACEVTAHHEVLLASEPASTEAMALVC